MYEINKKGLSVAMLNAGVKSAKDLAALAGVSANTRETVAPLFRGMAVSG